MKSISFLFTLVIISCNPQESQLSIKEISQIKTKIISLSEKHAQDLENLDYKEVMKFYADVDDFVIFGDGYYWGNYKTVDGIWKDFLNPSNWKEMIKWDLSNHKIYVISQDAVSYLVEFDNERIDNKGDTTMVTGCFTYGMHKIENQWKAVTVHVTHNYKPGHGFESAQPKYEAKKRGLDWWRYYSPEEIEKREEKK